MTVFRNQSQLLMWKVKKRKEVNEKILPENNDEVGENCVNVV